jgi:PAS domain S-box-containing protein
VDANILGLGFVLIVVGLLFFAAVRLLIRTAPTLRSADAADIVATQPLPNDHGEGVIIVQSGGVIQSVNERIRQSFHLQDGEQPDLERMLRRIRPANAFLALCGSEGRQSFMLDGKLVQGISYRLALGDDPVVLVTLRFPEHSTGLAGSENGTSAQTLQTFNELTQAIAASLDLEKSLLAVLENIEKLVAADSYEIKLYEEETRQLVSYHYSWVTSSDHRLEKSSQRSLVDAGYSGFLYRERQALFIQDIDKRFDLRPADGSMPGMRAFLGVALVAGKEFVGTIELSSRNLDAFREEDLNLVKMLSGQAAIAIHNSLIYREEQKKSAELSGLAQLAQAVGSARDPKSLYSRLVASIAPLVRVQILGFLIYNEAQHTLEGQIPYFGLPDQIMELYWAQVQPNSLLEQTLLEQDVLITEDAGADPQWEQLGLDHMARGASLHDTVLVPLNSGGHMLGYLQASNHSHGEGFSQSELHLLMIIANQTASIIENATLVQQTRQRAQRSESLRRIISLTSSAANLDEILQFSNQELARLLRADIGVIFLLDPGRTMLTIHRNSMFGSPAHMPERSLRLLIDDPQFPFSVTDTQRAMRIGRLSDDQAIIPFYRTMIDAWQLESLVAVPLVVRNEGIGEIWYGSQKANFFDNADMQLVATAAGQLAGAVEQMYLRGQTDEGLQHQVDQLGALMRSSRDLSNTFDLEKLLSVVHAAALRLSGADGGTVLFFQLNEDEERLPIIRQTYGDAHRDAFNLLELRVIETNSPERVEDYQQAGVTPPNDAARSGMVVPILYHQRISGLITLWGKKASAFDDESLEIIQSLAVQAAAAVGNAVQYADQNQRSLLLKRELDTLGELLEVSQMLRPSLPLEQSLVAIGAAIRDATPFQVNVISVYDPQSGLLRRVVSTGLSSEQWVELESRKQLWVSIEEMLKPEFRNGNVYYIPADQQPVIPQDVFSVEVDQDAVSKAGDAWDSDDFLLVTLYDSNRNPLGLISVDRPVNGRRPDRPTFEALEIFGIQAGLMIENHLRTSSLEKKVHELELEKLRLIQSEDVAHENLPLMLRKDLDQTMELQSVNRRIERIRASLEIASMASSQPDTLSVLNTLCTGLLTRYALHTALIAEKTPAGMRLVEVIGSVPTGLKPEALFGQRNPLRQMLQESENKGTEVLLVSNLDNHPNWANNPLLNGLEAKSLICLLLAGEKDNRTAVLVVGRRSQGAFSDEDRRVFEQLAQQVSTELQNLQLLTETQSRLGEVNQLLEFSLKLTSLKPDDILHALVENVCAVVPNGQSGWVGLLDEKGTSFIPQVAFGYVDEAAMLKIHYGLTAEGLFSRVARTSEPQRLDEVDFAKQYRLAQNDLLNYRQASHGRLPMSCMVLPLRLSDRAGGVLVLENFESNAGFSPEDEALAYSFTQQASLTLDNARLYQASELRAGQLQNLTHVSSRLASNLKQEELIHSLLDLLRMVIPYETATLWVRSGSRLSVMAANGFEDDAAQIGLSAAVEDSQLFLSMFHSGEPIVIGDVRNDERFSSLVVPEHLSWLGLPFILKGEVAGLIALEKHEPDFYTREHIQVASTFISQAAVAMENARLFEESERRATELAQRSQRLALLNQLSEELGASLDSSYILKLTSQHLLHALNVDLVSSVMIGPGERFILEEEEPEQTSKLPIALLDVPMFERLKETRGIFSSSNVETEREMGLMYADYLAPRGIVSILVVPLITGTTPHGWLMIEKRVSYRFQVSEIELARTMCNQSAIAIQNARLFDETRSLTQFLEKRVEERTGELRREHQNSKTLLRVISELSTSLDMGLVLNRALAVINESLGSQESMTVLLQGTQKPFRAGLTLAAEPGTLGRTINLEREITRWVARSRRPALVDNVLQDERWTLPEDEAVAYRSVLAVPLVMGEDVLGALLLFHSDERFFRPNQVSLAEATARQIGISLNNAELFNLIRDQSEHLGHMLREQQIEASRSRAILEAVADGVVVTDDHGLITLFNGSAERILELKPTDVIGQPIDLFSGLFGRSGSAWMHTINNWSKEPRSYQGEIFADRFDLDNGNVMDVHLAPVFWRSQFLGTVSIFRDITHEVQVDRMKSEFVANVSHELRTPMTSIKGYVEIMLMGAGGELNAQQRHFLEIVKNNTERLSVLVNDLLDLSRIESGRVTLNMQSLDLSQIIHDVVEEMNTRSKEDQKPMTFKVETADDMPPVRGDLERVRQIVSNLLGNSFNYTPDDGEVNVRIHSNDGEVQVDVKDNGIGIGLEEQHRVFERFFRGDDPLVLKTAGTGLGLAVSKTLVMMHNGRIWFKSSGVRGEGSIFSFTLPVEENGTEE